MHEDEGKRKTSEIKVVACRTIEMIDCRCVRRNEQVKANKRQKKEEDNNTIQ